MMLNKRLLLLVAGLGICFGAFALDIPALKPGLWEMRVETSMGGGMGPTTVCVGAMTSENRQIEEANVKARCTKYESKKVGGQWVVDAVCTARGKTITKHVTASLSGEAFHEENTAAKGSMTSDGKWLGPCKPGEVPTVFK